MESEVDPEVLAATILAGFDNYRTAFKTITSGAQGRFERGQWIEAQRASADRIELYDKISSDTVSAVDHLMGGARVSEDLWRQVKQAYQVLISERPDHELAQTVFNTVFRKLYPGQLLDNELVFLRGRVEIREKALISLCQEFGPDRQLKQLLKDMLQAYAMAIPFKDLDDDIALMVDQLRKQIPLLRDPEVRQRIRFQVLKNLFYRNKGAYIVGRMLVDEHVFPIAIPLMNRRGQLVVDAIVWTENDLSMVFSFTRSYFMVDVDYPNEMVVFLQELLPAKKRSELYASIGFYKHGKTEFYRGFLNHLEHSDDEFVIAEGIKGMVMAVFTLPSYQTVFKIIKDKFSPTKTVTHQQVKDAYYLVKTHDRVGRMADTQEFQHFVLPRARFSPDLLVYLQEVAGSSVRLTDNEVIISHLYTERQMTPLNIYIHKKSGYDLLKVLDEYGTAIKELAAANIFPGDMLLKNFGVTRHGRVVFYDYDEICYLTDVNFRAIPPARYPEDQYAAEPWYDVGPDDVFPEEFGTFLFNSGKLKELFVQMHGDLFEPDFWQRVQENIQANRVIDVFPYRQDARFSRMIGG